MGACMLVAASRDRRGRPARRVVLPLQRGDRLVLPLPPGRLEGALLPRRGVRPRRRRLPRRPDVPGEPARAPALPRQALAAAAEAERARRLLRRACRLRGARFGASEGACTAMRRAGSAPGDVARAARSRRRELDPALLRLALATGVVLWPGCRRSRARSACGAPRRRVCRGRWRSLFGALAVTFVVGTRRSRSTLVLLLGAGVVGARRSRPSARGRRPPGWGSWRWPGSCSASCSGTSPARSAATGSSTSRGCASSSRSATSRLHRVDEFPDGGLHPGYAFPLWHGFLALVAKIAGVDPARVVLHERVDARAARGARRGSRPAGRCSAAGRAALAYRRGVGRARCDGVRPRRLVHVAGAAGDRLAAAARARGDRACRSRRCAAPRRGRVATLPRPASRSSVVHPTYALFVLIPFAGFLVVRWVWAARGRARRACSRRRALRCLPRAFVALADPDHPRYGLGRARRRSSVPAGWRSTRRSSSCSRRTASASRPQVLGAVGRRRRRRARARAARRARGPPPLGGVRRRRLAGGRSRSCSSRRCSCRSPTSSRSRSPAAGRRSSRSRSRSPAGSGSLDGLLGGGSSPRRSRPGSRCSSPIPGDFGYVLHGTSPSWPAWVAVVGGAAALVGGCRARAPARALERAGRDSPPLSSCYRSSSTASRHWSPSRGAAPSPLTRRSRRRAAAQVSRRARPSTRTRRRATASPHPRRSTSA